MPKTRKDPYRGRNCKLCKGHFIPTTKNSKNADGQEFCCDAHRKEFWKYGSLPFAKMAHRMEKRMREIAREEIASALDLDAEFERIREQYLNGPITTSTEQNFNAEFDRLTRIKERLTGKGPIGREAAQALVDSFSPSRQRAELERD